MKPVLTEELNGLRENVQKLLLTIEQQQLEIERLRKESEWVFVHGMIRGSVIGFFIPLFVWVVGRTFG